MARPIFLFLLFCISASTTSMAHSIRFDVKEHPPVVKVHAYFSMTSPLVNAKVEVSAPGSDAVYQRGRTDQAGYFVFIPVEVGDWVVRFDDERGHRGSTVVSITDAFFQAGQADESVIVPTAEAPPPTTDDIPLVYRIIFGLALIFGLTGVLYGLKARQSKKSK